MATATLRPSLPSGGTGSAGGAGDAPALHVWPGPLLTHLESRRASGLNGYRQLGGYSLLARVSDAGDSEPFLAELDRAGVRGRGGGGYPTAHKWFLAARGETGPKHFVCNANAHTGDRKVPYLLALSPHAVLEAVAVGAVLSGASEAYLALPADDGLTGLYE
ncbi:MAG TPA: hypothetical protein VFE05_17285, partial [Longimicrobiaceae bacterium]|nr:hypothetical protein [Longimicrobiaceae bacterium]